MAKSAKDCTLQNSKFSRVCVNYRVAVQDDCLSLHIGSSTDYEGRKACLACATS